MHVKTIVPLIGLHLNFIGLACICSEALMLAIAALCWFGNTKRSRFVGITCLVAIYLVGAVITAIYLVPTPSHGFGEGATEYLFCSVVLAFLASGFVTIGTYVDFDDWGDDPGDDSPESDGGPPSDSIDWDEFNRARGEWSRPRVGALTS